MRGEAVGEVMFCPLDGFLRALCDGWSLPFIVEPMTAHHGHYAVLLWRDVSPDKGGS